MATETVQMKVSGKMCSFCTMSIERALKRYLGVNSLLVNLVHGVVLSRPTCPRLVGRSLLQDPALRQRCHDEYRNDR
jgi:hypothetical protein